MFIKHLIFLFFILNTTAFAIESLEQSFVQFSNENIFDNEVFKWRNSQLKLDPNLELSICNPNIQNQKLNDQIDVLKRFSKIIQKRQLYPLSDIESIENPQFQRSFQNLILAAKLNYPNHDLIEQSLENFKKEFNKISTSYDWDSPVRKFPYGVFASTVFIQYSNSEVFSYVFKDAPNGILKDLSPYSYLTDLSAEQLKLLMPPISNFEATKIYERLNDFTHDFKKMFSFIDGTNYTTDFVINENAQFYFNSKFNFLYLHAINETNPNFFTSQVSKVIRQLPRLFLEFETALANLEAYSCRKNTLDLNPLTKWCIESDDLFLTSLESLSEQANESALLLLKSNQDLITGIVGIKGQKCEIRGHYYLLKSPNQTVDLMTSGFVSVLSSPIQEVPFTEIDLLLVLKSKSYFNTLDSK